MAHEPSELLPEDAHQAASLYLAEEGNDTPPDDGSEESDALGAPVPDVPRLTANRTANKGIVRLRWGKSDGADLFSLYRGTAVNPTSLLVAGLTDGKYDDDPGDGTFHYRVRAVADATPGDYSNDVPVNVKR